MNLHHQVCENALNQLALLDGKIPGRFGLQHPDDLDVLPRKGQVCGLGLGFFFPTRHHASCALPEIMKGRRRKPQNQLRELNFFFGKHRFWFIHHEFALPPRLPQITGTAYN